MGSGLKSTDEQSFLAQLGVRVRRARARAGITRRRLSQICGVSERYLAQLEAGEGNISVVLIRRVAAALGVELTELLAAPVDPSRRSRIALLGLRGAGKSTLGARLAERIGAPFLELRVEVARDLGTPAEGVFAVHGSEAYREAERRTLGRLIDGHERFVLATTGALVLEATAYQLLRTRCVTVWLRATPEDHLARVVAQGDLRPIQGRDHALLELRALLAQRERLYQLADATVDTSTADEDACLERLTAVAADGWSAGVGRSDAPVRPEGGGSL